MKRLALIIKGHSQTEEEEQSDVCFVNAYYRYFNSIAGGAWEDDEIKILDEPQLADVASIINTIKPTYAVTVLIGHGGTQTNHQLFQLDNDTVIKPGQFIFDAEKQLVILESCRTNIDDIHYVDLENKIPTYRFGGYIRGHIDRETSKQLFIAHLNNCNSGVVVCFACSKNQSAYNYFFSSELIQCGQNLFLNTLYHYRTFGILDMMPYLIKRVTRKARKAYGIEQQPEIMGSINFPFAVSKFDLLKFEKEKIYEEPLEG